MNIYRKEIGCEESLGANISELDPLTALACMLLTLLLP